MAYGLRGILDSVPGWQERLYEKIDSATHKHFTPWKVVPAVAIFVSMGFWYLFSRLPWILWKQMLIDYLMVIACPLYLAIFSDRINDIWECSLYESQSLQDDVGCVSKDVYLHIWEETKYYPYIEKKNIIPCVFGDDVSAVLDQFGRHVVRAERERIEPVAE